MGGRSSRWPWQQQRGNFAAMCDYRRSALNLSLYFCAPFSVCCAWRFLPTATSPSVGPSPSVSTSPTGKENAAALTASSTCQVRIGSRLVSRLCSCYNEQNISEARMRLYADDTLIYCHKKLIGFWSSAVCIWLHPKGDTFGLPLWLCSLPIYLLNDLLLSKDLGYFTIIILGIFLTFSFSLYLPCTLSVPR